MSQIEATMSVGPATTGTMLLQPVARTSPGIVVTHPGLLSRYWRRALLGGAAVLALAAASQLGASYWTVGRFQVSTDDAYVQADNTTIAPKVSGYLSAVLVNDNQPVKTGQVLARIAMVARALSITDCWASSAACRSAIVACAVATSAFAC